MRWLSWLWLWLVVVSQCTAKHNCSSSLEGSATERRSFEYLTDPCRYDKTSRAPSPPDVPLKITLRTFIYYLRAFSNKNEMNMLILLELEWTDPRLNFVEVNPNISHIRGEKVLFSDRMWLPHTYLTNEKTTEVMGNVQKDNFINIDPSGRVHFIGRLRSTLTCSPVNTEWFPFDKEECELLINSWHYDSRDVVMEWKKDRPVEYRNELSPVDYYLTDIESTSGLEVYVNANEDCTTSCKYNHSSLALTFKFARQSGFYLLDYYFPSIVLVSASWVTFWLDPDSTPGRAAVGSSTMLTFLMLGWTGSKIPNAPFKVNDIWELSCTGFILASLAEFALVNTTFRRESKKVELKKKTGKYILQYSVSPKKVTGRRTARRSSSVPSSPEIRRHFLGKYNKPKMKTIKELTDSEFRTSVTRRVEKLLAEEQSIPMIRLNRPSPQIVIDEESDDENTIRSSVVKPVKKSNDEASGLLTMTPQEIARWIDTQSRIVFPLAFLVFNLIYWNFLWIPQILGS